MRRNELYGNVDPFSQKWRDLYEERKLEVQLIFEPQYGVPKHPLKGWLVEDLLPCGYLVLLAGKPKDGKTNLVATLAHAISQGLPFAGMRTAHQNVLYISAEESGEEWRLAMDPYLPKEREGFRVGFSQDFRLDYNPDLWGLARAIDHYKAALVVIDPLLAAVDAGDFSNANRARNALTGLKALCMNKGVTAIVVHHAKERRGLARRVAENPQLAATASLNIVLNQRPYHGKRLVTLDLKGRGPFANRTLKLLSDGPCQYSGLPSSSPRGKMLVD
ncbi:MAG: AAA family ATPase, partial [Verrucomicrobiaceae bacterium]